MDKEIFQYIPLKAKVFKSALFAWSPEWGHPPMCQLVSWGSGRGHARTRSRGRPGQHLVVTPATWPSPRPAPFPAISNFHLHLQPFKQCGCAQPSQIASRSVQDTVVTPCWHPPRPLNANDSKSLDHNQYYNCVENMSTIIWTHSQLPMALQLAACGLQSKGV